MGGVGVVRGGSVPVTARAGIGETATIPISALKGSAPAQACACARIRLEKDAFASH